MLRMTMTLTAERKRRYLSVQRRDDSEHRKKVDLCKLKTQINCNRQKERVVYKTLGS